MKIKFNVEKADPSVNEHYIINNINLKMVTIFQKKKIPCGVNFDYIAHEEYEIDAFLKEKEVMASFLKSRYFTYSVIIQRIAASLLIIQKQTYHTLKLFLP
jgi:hypothetical protein